MRAPHRNRTIHRLRVLQLAGFYRPHIGGLERVVETFATELAGRGHHVTVATTAYPDAPVRETIGGVDVVRLEGWASRLPFVYENPARPFAPPVPDPGMMRALAHLVAECKPDVVHAHDWLAYSLLALPLNMPVLLSLHDYSLVCPKKTYLHFGRACAGPAYVKCLRCSSEQYGPPKALAITSLLRTSAALNRRLARLLPVSSAVLEASVAGSGLPRHAFEVVPAPVASDLHERAVAQPRPDFLPDREYILFVGALGPHKGLDVLLDAYEGMSTKPPLVVVGMPRPDSPTSYPAGVTVVENVAHEAVLACYLHAMLTVVPSVCPDALPQVAAEAAAVGCPVVASAVGGLTELVKDGLTGVLVPPGDREALQGAMEALAGDPERRRWNVAAGREHARSFMVGQVVDQLEQLYVDLETQHRPIGVSLR